MVGHIIANSCEPASYVIDDKTHMLAKRLDSNADQSSFAERLINMPNAGAINVYMNYHDDF